MARAFTRVYVVDDLLCCTTYVSISKAIWSTVPTSRAARGLYQGPERGTKTRPRGDA
jgi:hypothetical protein